MRRGRRKERNLSRKRNAKPKRKLELSLVKKPLYVTGLAAKEPKVRRKVGLIVMLLTETVVINLVEDPTEKKERNIHHVDQPLVHVKRRVKASLGAKKQKKEKKERKNEINRSKIKIFD